MCFVLCGAFYRFQSGNTSFSGGSSHHSGPTMGWRPYREHVCHDGDDDCTAGPANGKQQLQWQNHKASCQRLSVNGPLLAERNHIYIEGITWKNKMKTHLQYFCFWNFLYIVWIVHLGRFRLCTSLLFLHKILQIKIIHNTHLCFCIALFCLNTSLYFSFVSFFLPVLSRL